MRIGANPAKSGLPAYTPKKLGIALIVYIPLTEGYFANSLDIFKIQLASLHASTPQPFDLLIFDNGSCRAVVAELQRLYEQKQIDYLALSQHNLGKAGAWNWIFAAMPNELIVYADSDVFFRPGWLQASIEILEAFPEAGMIASQPNFFDVMEGQGKAQHRLYSTAINADERYAPSEYWPEKAIIEEYCLGIGASEELAAQFYQKPLPAITNKANQLQAVIGASHMQFLIPSKVARQVTPLPSTKALLRAETMALDYKIDDLGFLHLSTLKPYVFHMGNTLNDRVRDAAGTVDLPSIQERSAGRSGRAVSPSKSWLSALAKRPRFNRFFRRIYNLLFQVLYTEH